MRLHGRTPFHEMIHTRVFSLVSLNADLHHHVVHQDATRNNFLDVFKVPLLNWPCKYLELSCQHSNVQRISPHPCELPLAILRTSWQCLQSERNPSNGRVHVHPRWQEFIQSLSNSCPSNMNHELEVPSTSPLFSQK
jgi:hypothetical protein